MLKNKQINLKNIIAYIQGNIRYKLWNSPKLKWLIPIHIQEQIEMRIKYMKRECYMGGVCIKCGCITLALQMANKSCGGDCYPEMMNHSDWYRFRADGTYLTSMGYLDSKKVQWIYREDCLIRYNTVTGNKDILIPIDKTI